MGERLGIVLAATLWSLPAVADVSTERQQQLRHMLSHDCGSCHGLRLTGGLGPPLTTASLAERDVSTLVAVIRHGRPGTPMPPWKDLITDEEAHWLAEHMKGSAGEGETSP